MHKKYAHKICSSESTLKVELDQISKFMSWNGFPRRLSQKLKNTFKPSSSPSNQTNAITEPLDNIKKVGIRHPFLDQNGTKLLRKFTHKVNRLLKHPCKFIINWKTTEINCFVSCKD